MNVRSPVNRLLKVRKQSVSAALPGEKEKTCKYSTDYKKYFYVQYTLYYLKVHDRIREVYGTSHSSTLFYLIIKIHFDHVVTYHRLKFLILSSIRFNGQFVHCSISLNRVLTIK